MATYLTTSYERVAQTSGSWTYGGVTYSATLEVFGKYEVRSSSVARIYFWSRITVSNPGSQPWTGTNRYARLRFQWDEGGTGDSGYNQETTTFATGTNTYGLYEVYKDVSFGTEVAVQGYYGVAPGATWEMELYANASSLVAGQAPSNPTFSLTSTTYQSIVGTFSVSSWGTPSSGRFEYYFGTTSSTTDNYTLLPASGYTSSTSQTVTRAGLDANTAYYFRVRTWNGSLNNTGGFMFYGPYYTVPEAPTVFSVDFQTRASYNTSVVTFNYTVPADGGALTKTLYYSTDGVNWISSGETINTGSQTSGTFTATFSAGQTLTVYLRSTTTSGNSESVSLTFDTLPASDIEFDIDAKDINPVTVALTGNDHVYIYQDSILQITVDNLKSYYNTGIGTIAANLNNRNFTGTTTYTTDSNGVTTNDAPAIITYGSVDFTGTKTLTVTVSDDRNINSYTKTMSITVVQRPEIQNVTYSWARSDLTVKDPGQESGYLTSTMTVNSWYNAGNKAIVRCRLYWEYDNGVIYDYTISDLTNSSTADPNIPWITITPTKWTANTSADVPDVTAYTEFTVTIDCRYASGLYTGSTPWVWVPDNSDANSFDAFTIEWTIETETGTSTKTVSNLASPMNFALKVVEAEEVNGVLVQKVRDCSDSFVRILNSALNQQNKQARRYVLIKPDN